jgi:hypothetical protein
MEIHAGLLDLDRDIVWCAAYPHYAPAVCMFVLDRPEFRELPIRFCIRCAFFDRLRGYSCLQQRVRWAARFSSLSFTYVSDFVPSSRFVDEYMKLVWAASNGDRDSLLASSVKLGFLTGTLLLLPMFPFAVFVLTITPLPSINARRQKGEEPPVMMSAHWEAARTVGEPFRSDSPFSFAERYLLA